ncbi:MAG: UDP-glucose/GDP-mannose dehydrogenase family protein [Candidatus Diapherotrites archaeon]
MRVAIIGTGYVGLVSGACLADLGHDVTCVDIDKEKIRLLTRGKSPIYEPGLEKIIKRNLKRGLLRFTNDTKTAVRNAYVVMLTVGTPQTKNGKPDLRDWIKAAKAIAASVNEEKVIVNKSTVLVGTTEMLKRIIAKNYKGNFYVVSNPEFLREGSAVNDFMKPDRIVIGFEDPKAKKAMQELYKGIRCKKLYTDIRTAELIKYASNAFLVTKISFINEIALLCEKVGANVVYVAKGMGLDKRIGPYFLRAGCGWGGSCFPKDVRALIYFGKKTNVKQNIVAAAFHANEKAKLQPIVKLKRHLGNLNGKKIAILGLAFKPNTDDVRDASSLTIIKALKKEGAKVSAYDPVAVKNMKKIVSDIHYAKDAYQTAKGAYAIVLVTEWPQFAKLNFNKLKKYMKNPLIIDGRNFLNKKTLTSIGFTYEGIGT